jgi:DNA-binding transcriptional MerR regulator
MTLLKVGELAKRTGLTVRALHHFDALGLLKPSARSESGYRLYNRDDVARLHGIQALRHLGLPLKDIGSMLAGDGAALPGIVARQIRALDHEITQATDLRNRLTLLMGRLESGGQPEMGEWLESLALMATYSRYFSPDEIRQIVGGWPAVAPQWPPLLAETRRFMDEGVPPDDPRLQPLANHWMGLVHHWLGGNFDLIDRWGQVHLQEAPVRRTGGPDLAMVRYIDQACALRMTAWLRHFSMADLSRFVWVPPAQWQMLDQRLRDLVHAFVPPGAPAARAAAAQVHRLMRASVGGDERLLAQLQAAMAAEPVLRAGATLSEPARAYLLRVQAATPQSP